MTTLRLLADDLTGALDSAAEFVGLVGPGACVLARCTPRSAATQRCDRYRNAGGRLGRVIPEVEVNIPAAPLQRHHHQPSRLCSVGAWNPRFAHWSGGRVMSDIAAPMAIGKVRPKRHSRKGVNGSVIGAIALIVLFVAWDVGVRVLEVPSYIMPAPAAVGRALWSGLAVSPLGCYLPLWSTL